VVKTVEKMGPAQARLHGGASSTTAITSLLTIEANGAVVLEARDARLRVTEPVIKFITVRIDEEEKRLAKVKALRGVAGART